MQCSPTRIPPPTSERRKKTENKEKSWGAELKLASGRKKTTKCGWKPVSKKKGEEASRGDGAERLVATRETRKVAKRGEWESVSEVSGTHCASFPSFLSSALVNLRARGVCSLAPRVSRPLRGVTMHHEWGAVQTCMCTQVMCTSRLPPSCCLCRSLWGLYSWENFDTQWSVTALKINAVILFNLK